MKNDFIEFDFSNNDSRPVLLNPQIVPELANALAQILHGLMHLPALAQEVPQPESNANPLSPEFSVLLGAVRHGSVKLAFDVTFSLKGEKEVSEATLQKIKSLLWQFLVAGGVGLGLFAPIAASPSSPPLLDGPDDAVISEDNPVAQSYRNLVKVMSRGKADKVIIMVPEQRGCVVPTGDLSGISFLGIDAPDMDRHWFGSEIFGRLKLVPGKMDVELGGIPKTLYLAEIENSLDTHQIFVLVSWESKFNIDEIDEGTMYEYKGAMERIDRKRLRLQGPISEKMRGVSAILHVKGIRGSFE